MQRLWRLWSRYRDVPIIYRISIAFVVGSTVGLAVGQPATALKPLGDLFLRLLEMLVVPLIVFTLLGGVEKLTPSKAGRIGGLVVAVYMVTTAIAGFFGIAVGNLLNPGTGVEFTGGEAVSAEPPNLAEVFLNIVPTNPVAALVEGQVLSIIFFTLVFGLGLTVVRSRTDSEDVRTAIERFFDFVEAGTEALFTVVWGVMEYAVVGVFALMAASLAENGVDAVFALASLVGAIAIAVVLHMAVTYLGLITAWGLGRSPIDFLDGAKDAMVTAFTIRSSSGTLPVTMRNAEEDLAVDESVYGFSLPLGATINMDGAAIRQAITAIFAANLFGISLGLGDQIILLLTVVLVSIGTAGVPGAGIIMLTVVLESVGLPLTVVGFVAGVARRLGRIATMNNVTGDLAVSTLVAKWNDAVDFSSGVWQKSRSVGGFAPAANDD